MPKGRPREFDAEKALDEAMLLFWRHGYEGTSLASLAEAMGVNMPSIYAAFGNKENLFGMALQRYLQRHASYLPNALKAATARQAVEEMFAGAIDMVTNSRNPDGCLLVQGALASGPDIEPVQRELAKRRRGAEDAVRRRFELAVESGELPKKTDTARLARFIMTVIWGMAVQAAGGATRAQLREVADAALDVWPG